MTAAALRLQIYQFRTNYAAIFAEYSAFSQQNFAPVRAKIAAAAFFAKAPAAKAQLFVGIEEFTVCRKNTLSERRIGRKNPIWGIFRSCSSSLTENKVFRKAVYFYAALW